MENVKFDLKELPDWERVITLVQQLDVYDQNRIYGYIQGSQAQASAQKGKNYEQDDAS